MNFSDFLSNLCCSQAMTDFWGPKTSYANAGHSCGHIPMRAHQKHLSSLTGSSLRQLSHISSLSGHFLCWVSQNWNTSNSHIYSGIELKNEVFLWIHFMFLVEMVTYTVTLTKKYSFWRLAPVSPTLFWFWQHKSYCLIKMQTHEYFGSEQIMRR